MPLTYILVSLAIFIVALTIVIIARRTQNLRVLPAVPRPLKDNRLPKLDSIRENYIDGELICRPGYLRFSMDYVVEMDEKDEGLFVGYAKADAQHEHRITIYSDRDEIVGWLDGQQQLYSLLLSWGRSPLYGAFCHSAGQEWKGDVCVRVRS